MAVTVATRYEVFVGDDVSPFIGAYATNEVPGAETVTAGYYYWDLTRARPYWSDGAIWRDSGATTSPPPPEPDPEDPDAPDPGLAVRFTLAEGTTQFAPSIYLVAGATGDVLWVDDDDVILETGVNPTITDIPVNLAVTLKVVSGEASVMSEVEVINLGFDHTEDTGPETPDASYDYPPQPVVGVSSLSGLANLKYFMAADTPLTGTLNFTDLPNVLSVECFSSEVEEVLFSGTSINRLCLERCRITELDLTPIASTIRDLRCAVGQGGPVTFHSDATLEHLWHYCVRDQTVTEHIPMAQMPELIQYWAWNTGITEMDVPASDVLDSIIIHHNAMTTETLDAWLITLAAGTHSNGNFDAAHADPPTAASDAAVATLLARGWVLEIPVAVGDDEGWVYDAPTQVDWVGAALTGLSVTPSVTSGDLSYAANVYARVIQRPATRNAGDVFFEVVADRADLDGSSGTDMWALIVNCASNGANGLKAMIRWPETNGSNASGVIIGNSSQWSNSVGTVVRVNPNPTGWTDAGPHKIGLLHQGAVATVILDGVKVYQCATAGIDSIAGGGYVGVGGDTDNVTRTYQTWGLEEIV